MNKFILNILILLFFASNIRAQDAGAKFKWGFDFQTNFTNLQIVNSDASVHLTNTFGYGCGILAEWNLSKNISFVPKINLSFSNTKIAIINTPDFKESFMLYPVKLDFSTHLVYKFEDKKTKPYVLFGPTFKTPLMGDHRIRYATKKSDLALDFGVGLEKLFPNFVFSPEIRYSVGIMNLSGFSSIGQLYLHEVILALNFK